MNTLMLGIQSTSPETERTEMERVSEQKLLFKWYAERYAFGYGHDS